MEIIFNDGTKAHIKLVDVRELHFQFTGFPKFKQEEEIEELIYDKQIIAKKGEVFNHFIKSSFKYPFKVNKIIKLTDKLFSVLTAERSKAYIYLLPLLFSDCKTIMSELLVNVYLGCFDSGFDGSIYLAYRFSGTKEFKEVEKILTNHRLYVTSLNIDDYHTLYQYAIDEDDYSIYELFVTGQYSKFPETYKKKICDFFLPITKNLKNSQFYQVLYKDQRRKLKLEKELGVSLPEDAELLDIPSSKTEIYREEFKIC